MPWVIKRPSGKWQGRYRLPDGTEKSAGTYKLKREAADAAREAETEALKPKGKGYDSGMTWGEWCATWWTTRAIENSTVSSESFMIKKHLEPHWRDIPLAEINRHDVQAWVAKLTAPDYGLKPGSVRRVLTVLVSSLSAAVDAELIPVNPAVRIKLPPAPRGREVFLTHDQFDALIHAIDHQEDAALVYWLAHTGMRWGEAAGLHWHNLDTQRMIVTVADSYDGKEIKPYPKGRRQRHVPVFDFVLDEIPVPEQITACGVPHREGKCPSGLVFPSRSGGVRDDRNFSRRVLKPALKSAGLEDLGMTLHDLRHTYASWLVQGGQPLERIADLLGHASLSTTQIYAHLAPARHDELLASLRPKRDANGAQKTELRPNARLRAV